MKRSLGAKTIAWPLPVWVIGSYDAGGRPNAMAASWTGICCSLPPCAYFSARHSRFTHACVTARRAFTINIPGVDQLAAADYFGIASGRDTNKLAAAGLDTAPAELVDAPVLSSFPLIMECRLAQIIELGSHAMFIGEILDVKCDADLLGADGRIDASRLSPAIYNTADSSYYAVTSVLGGGYTLGLSIAERPPQP